MARFLLNKLTSTCAVTLLLTGCGGRTADVEDGWESSGGTASGGWTTSSGGKTGYGGSKAVATGGYYYGVGGYYYAYGGYATGGYYYSYGGYATGGNKATGGYPYATGGNKATGGYPYATGGKAAGGVSGYGTAGKATGATSGYGFVGGAGGKPSTAGSAGFLRGGAGGGIAGGSYAGSFYVTGGTANGGGAGTPPAAGAAGCPAIGCIASCPLGYWNSINGCSSCACAPPDKKLSFDTASCASESLTVSVTPLAQTGTWVFNFTWNCSATGTAINLPTMASVGVTIFNSATDPITTTNRTIIYNVATSSIPIVFTQPQIIVSTSSTSTATFGLTPLTGAYLSIRREGNQFVGGLYLPANPTTISTASSVMLAGSFTVAVPQ